MEFLIKNGKLLRALCDRQSREDCVRIPGHITAIGDNAFSDIQVREVLLPDSVTSIGLGAFSGCEELKSINIPERVGYIGREAFRDCCCLKEITIPARVTRLNDECFRGCRLLSTVRLHDKLIFGRDVFEGCVFLSQLDIGRASIRSRQFGPALKADPSCVERLTRAVRYGTIPDRVHGALRAQIAAELFISRGSEDAKKYLRRNAVEVFDLLAADGRSDLMLKLAAEEDIVTKDIDALIEAAIAAEQHEVYIMLTGLRHGTVTETVTDRFEL